MIRLFKGYYPVRNVFFVLGEGIFIFLAMGMSTSWLGSMGKDTPSFELSMGNVLITFICQICLYYNNMYNLNAVNSWKELFSKLIQALGGAAVILSGVHLWLSHGIISNTAFTWNLLIMATLVVSWRVIYTLILNCHVFDKIIILIGNSPLITSIIREVSSNKDSGYIIINVFPDSQPRECINKDVLLVKSCDDHYSGLSDFSKEINVKLIVSDKQIDGKNDGLEKELMKCRINGTKVIDANSFFEMVTGKLHVNKIKSGSLIFSEGFSRSVAHHAMKRVFDCLISLFLLVLLLPVMLATAILIKLESKGPVFDSQERLGKGKKPYKMYKFRSMTKQSGPAWPISGDSRVTRVGKYIRSFRIDEIPQLWNILKGDMSFVGPRPERDFCVRQLEKTIPHYGIRFTVKPGLTGWAQVNFGNGTTDENALEKLSFDLFYIKNSSLIMDLFIVFQTAKTVILGIETEAGPAVESKSRIQFITAPIQPTVFSKTGREDMGFRDLNPTLIYSGGAHRVHESTHRRFG